MTITVLDAREATGVNQGRIADPPGPAPRRMFTSSAPAIRTTRFGASSIWSGTASRSGSAPIRSGTYRWSAVR